MLVIKKNQNKNLTEENREYYYKRSLTIVVLSQILGGLGLAAGVTVGALIAQDMLGTDRYAGIPSALFTLGSAGAALLVGRISQGYGRRNGLSMGFLIGGIGAVGVISATALNNVILLFTSLLFYGFGTATNLQARYAGSDLALPQKRASAVSIAMVSTTIGAVLGPNMTNVMSNVAKTFNLPPLTGSFILSATAYIFASIVLFVFLRPDPFLLAKQLDHSTTSKKEIITPNKQAIMKQNVIVGAVIMVVTQMVMVAIMTMTPIHMQHNGHNLGTVGLVIGIHIGSMYLPSLVTGILINKIGTTNMGIMSGFTLFISALVALFSPGSSIAGLIIALSLLGIGWNFGLISGTTIIVNSTAIDNRAKVQGSIDVFIAIGGSFGGIVSGLIVNAFSFGALALLGAILSLLLVFYAWVYMLKHKKSYI